MAQGVTAPNDRDAVLPGQVTDDIIVDAGGSV